MSFTETLVIVIVALVAFGPKRLPEVARMLGHSMGRLRHWHQQWQRYQAAQVFLQRLDRPAVTETNTLKQRDAANEAYFE